MNKDPILENMNGLLVATMFIPTEHSENKIIAFFVNEVRPGVLHYNAQQIYQLQEFRKQRTESKYSQRLWHPCNVHDC